MGNGRLCWIQQKTGVSRLLGAFRQLAPLVLGLEGEMNFRQAMLEVLSEIREAKRSGKKVSIAEIAAQRSFTRSPEADAFLQFFAKNEREGGGVVNVVRVFSDLADFARTNADNAAQGVDLFGEVAQPTCLDLMRRFSDLTGVEIDEAKFRPVNDLKDAVKFENRPNVSSETLLTRAQEQINNIEPAPKFERIVVARDDNGREHAVIGVNGNPDLTVLPEGIDGIEALPIRLHEETLNRPHIRKHESVLKNAGYENIEQAIWDITQYYTNIYKGSSDNGLVLTRPLSIKNDDSLVRGVLQVELQREAGVYRVGSVFITDSPEYLKNRTLLWGTTQPIRLQNDASAELRTQELTGPEQPSVTDSIGQKLTDVNSLRTEQRLLEKAEDIAEANVVRESLNQLPQDAQSSIQKEALQAINETPTMRVQLDEGETSITAAEYLARQQAEAERIRQEAQQGVPEAVACVFLNNGID